MNKQFLLIVAGLTLGATACIDSNVDVREDNDAYTCETTDVPCVTQIIDSPAPLDACADAGITNTLVGSCWWEQCSHGEKMLVSKIAGVNCVFIPVGAPNDEFVVGTCNDVGECGSW